MKLFWHWARRGLAILIFLVLAWQGWYLGWVVWWKFANPVTTSFMAMRLDELREKEPRAELKKQWVPYARISNSLKRAVVAAEDAKFSGHEGFDWEGIQKALEKNQKKGRIVAGGSTISQQLAKNLFLSGDKTPWRKAQEAVITLMLEAVLDKRRILEIYLNVVEWGPGTFGAEAAARHYYGVSAAQLWSQSICPEYSVASGGQIT
jgi:monofunctional biosynthetic peptidoglycan transglycosylase